jgi:hypothetical protein
LASKKKGGGRLLEMSVGNLQHSLSNALEESL